MRQAVWGVLGGLALSGIGVIWWQGRAAIESGAPPPAAGAPAIDPQKLPLADPGNLKGPLPPELTDDEWQPSSRDAHLEGITRQVKRGDPGTKSGNSRRRRSGGAPGAPFLGPMDQGPGGARFGGAPAGGERRRKPGGARGAEGRGGPYPGNSEGRTEAGGQRRPPKRSSEGRRSGAGPVSGAPGGTQPQAAGSSGAPGQRPAGAGTGRSRRRRRPGPKKPV